MLEKMKGKLLLSNRSLCKVHGAEGSETTTVHWRLNARVKKYNNL